MLAALVAHVLLPLGGMPRGDGPGSDICSAGGLTTALPGHPASPHDGPCCKAHCLSCFGAGGLPSTPAAPALAGLLHHARPWPPGGRVPAETAASPFAARAPPPAA